MIEEANVLSLSKQVKDQLAAAWLRCRTGFDSPLSAVANHCCAGSPSALWVCPDVDINKQPPAPRTAHTRCWDSGYSASLPRMRWDKRVQTGAVLLWLLLLPALLAPAIITGKGGLGPEAKFDADAMFGVPSSAQLRPYDGRDSLRAGVSA